VSLLAGTAVIPLPHDPVEACGRNPIAVFTMKQASRKVGLLNHFIYGLSMILREYDHGDFRQRYAIGLTAVQDSAPSFFPLTGLTPFH
jgi:hypothetical protein